MITIHHLRILQQIATQGSITRAASEMHLTQSALSHQIRDLEANVGVELLRRQGRKLHFTEAGHRVLQSAQTVLAEVHALSGDLQRLRAHAAGRIRLSIECYTCYQWLAPAITALRGQHPEIDITLVPEAATDPVTSLAQGRLDMAITSDGTPAPPWIKTPLFTGDLVVVVGTAHPWASRNRPLIPSDFSSETLLLYNAKRPVSLEQKPFFASLRPHATLEVPLTEAVVELIQAGTGISIMPYWMIRPFLSTKNLCLLPLPAEARAYAWYACVAPRAAPIVDCFISLVQAMAPVMLGNEGDKR